MTVDRRHGTRLRMETIADGASRLEEDRAPILARTGPTGEAAGAARTELVDLVRIERAHKANDDALKAMESVLRMVAGNSGQG